MKAWETQNKIIPGVYGKERSEAENSVAMSDRGVVSIPAALSFGPSGMQRIKSGENLLKYIGYTILDPEALFIKEIFKNAHTLYLYNTNTGGEKATATIGELVITSKYPGSRGNAIKVVAEETLDSAFEIEVYIGTEIVETLQGITSVEDIKSSYISATGTLQETAGLTLKGGTDGTTTNNSYITYLEQVEKLKDLNAIGYIGSEEEIKELFAMATKRIRDDIGNKIQCVLADYKQADNRAIYSVKNGVILGGAELTNIQCVPFVLGAVGGVSVTTSLTHFTYQGAIKPTGDLTTEQIKQALLDGEIVFIEDDDTVKVQQDVTTLKTYDKKNPKLYRKGRPSRATDNFDKDIDIVCKPYIGKGDNTDTGRGEIKKDIFKLAQKYQEQGAFKNVAIEDFTVEEGEEADGIYLLYAVQPVDSIDKIYIERVIK